MEELWYRIKYFIEDNKQIVLVVTLILVSILLVLLTISAESSQGEVTVDKDLAKQLDEYEEKKEELQKYFSLITYNNSGKSEQRPILDLTLFLKTPYEDEQVIREQVQNIIELYKQQYNISKTQFLAGMRIDIYTRYYDYEHNLDPEFKAEYYYKHLEPKEMKDLRKREKNGERIDIKDIHWVNTSNLTKMPDYSDYSFSLIYTPYNIDVVALSDEEYEFYMKIEKYRYLTGQTRRAISLYLSWEYGIPIKSSTHSISLQFEKFLDRQFQLVGSRENPWEKRFYDYESTLVLENPALVLYAKYGIVAQNNIEASQLLIKSEPDKYRDLFVKHYMENNSLEELEEIEDVERMNELSEKLNEILDKATDEDNNIELDGIDLEEYEDILNELE